MKKFTWLWVIFLSGCAHFQEIPLDQDHFKQTIVVNDDYLNAQVIFSTIKGMQQRQGAGVWNDNFMRGFLDKRTGTKTYQVYNVIDYSGPGNGHGWKLFSYVDYLTPQGTKLAPVTLVKKEENCSALEIYGNCVYREHATFKIDENLLRNLVKTSINSWEYHLVADSGQVLTNKLMIAEIAGLLASMNEYIIAPTAMQKAAPPKAVWEVPEALVKPLSEK